MGVEKAFDLMRRKYIWPGLYRNVRAYVNSSIKYQAISEEDNTALLMETNVPSYPFEKISMENQNEMMRDVLESLNVSYTTSPFITPRLMQRWNVYIAFWVTYWPNLLKREQELNQALPFIWA